MAKVTVGLPFHNEQASLADAVRSVFAQTFTDWELILMDDGSTDGSREIAERIHDPRVRLVSDGARRRLPARLNQIVDLAKSDLVARLDADDMMHPSRLERQVRMLAEQPSLDLVSSGLFELDARGELTGVITVPTPGTVPPLVSSFGALRRGLVAHATMTARRSWLLANRYDERYPRAEDRELFARTCAGLRFVRLPEPLYLHFHRGDAAASLRDYIASSRDNRRIFGDHARALVGPFASAPLMAESLAKELAFRAVTALGGQHRLVRRRGRAPTSAEREEVASALRVIRATAVPGLERPGGGAASGSPSVPVP